MVINKRKSQTLVVILLSGFLINYSSCKSFCPDGSDTYNLAGGVANFSPVADSIKVGDTLWFNSTIPTKLQPVQNGQPINDSISFSGASNVSTQINFHAIPKRDTITGAVDSFTYIKGKGNFIVNKLIPHDAETISFIEEDNTYEFSFGIVAKKKGIYCLTVIDIYQAQKKCNNASIEIQFGDSLNKHLYFLNDVYFPGSTYEPTIPLFELTHDYCFKVY